ncbi:MAG: DUF1080 domain-containing protein [Sedimentisphaerales bacterium]|nr:DUF1080 domain-containing protein [Sedimentisphaerales bacterium]
MRTVLICVTACVLVILSGCAIDAQVAKKGEVRQYVNTDSGRWLVHDMNRPLPRVVQPGTESTQDQPGEAPSDGIVLFNGKDLSEWSDSKGGQSKWITKDGYMECVKDSGYIQSKRIFGSCQLHVEFATPATVKGDGQGRGNSGVFLMGQYEVQVLDSYNNKTYPDGQCAALYGRAVPLVNSSRGPGQWQSYDIIFHRPVFEGKKVVKKATFSVFHNGVLVHDNVGLEGGTGWINKHAVTDYVPHEDKGPIMLQDHGNPVRYRNIWIRELAD